MNEPTESRDAWAELLATLGEIGDRFAGEEWMITQPDDVAEGLRLISHSLAAAIETHFEQDLARPLFRPIVTSWRKCLGDNADAMYHDAPIHPDGVYEITGKTGGAVYVSFTAEAGALDGDFPTGTVGVCNDTMFDVADDGSFRITVGGPEQARNWMPMDPTASRITVRHYWEDPEPPAAPPEPDMALAIRLVSGDVPTGPRSPTDESVAASLRRVARYMRARTMDSVAPPGTNEPPAFVSQVPNQFPTPVKPGDHALAAADAAYSMAPYVLGPDEALVITARWPDDCRCANVNLWNRQMQTYDYLRHPVALNRSSTVAEADGSIRVVIAHEDPGVPNWLDTEGRPFGLVFWRYMLPESPIDTPTAEVVKLASLTTG